MRGGKGYSWPDFINRWCTTLFKTNIIIKYLKKYEKDYNVIQYIGIAYDEEKRIKNKSNVVYPLYENKITEKDALEYCYKKGFDWNGLYNYFSRLSCWCCPLKNLKELKIMYENFPEYWNKLKEWDKNTYRKFKYKYTVQELEDKFNNEK